MMEPSPQDKKGRKKRRQPVAQARPPRRRLPNLDNNSIHQQHHQVRAMQEHRHMPNYNVAKTKECKLPERIQ